MAGERRASRGTGRVKQAPGDDYTFSERLLIWSRAVGRWASPGPRLAQNRSAWGCLNPILLFKIIVILLLVVFLPVYMLPIMLVRLVTFGGSMRKYTPLMSAKSGEQARFGTGALDPAADPQTVQTGAATIAAHDPDFDPAMLTDWAAAATKLICQSLTAADATPTRTFMANGLFRTYMALLELRGEAEVTCEGSWQGTETALVEAIATPLVDEVRVRVTCSGWGWERHAPTGLTIRGGPDPRTWSEDLTFGRSANAISPVAGGLPAKHCPSCGADLDLDDNGACRHCNSVVTAGRHDWVLTSWRREGW
jgi:hypothetical protein